MTRCGCVFGGHIVAHQSVRCQYLTSFVTYTLTTYASHDMLDHAVQEAHVAREAIHSALHDALHAVGPDVLSQWRHQHASVAPFDSLLLVSVSDGYTRAQVTTLTVDVSALRAGQWEVLMPALEQAITRLQRKFGHPLVGCRIEWPFAVREGRWGRSSRSSSATSAATFAAVWRLKASAKPDCCSVKWS